jgi:hypothetical protein
VKQECLLNEVARVAHKPMDRFSNDLRSEQNAKSLAFEILGHARDPPTATDRFLPWPALQLLDAVIGSQ